ncbi:universal stress protein [Pedobacter gandavensis]|uniref:universal stress protein n=1 Tax=Pedobacter gandavensis TaxID=2679963 RepID=UPI00247A39A4|nr:universal stress protein [Pedobacter gandavensis]WGQ09843.1 universal stress protein [Pedobacter gandavensis]
MKNFLAVFDGYKLCKSTFDYAVALAKKSDSCLTGVFLDAFFYHNYNLRKVLKDSSDPEADMKVRNEKDQLQRDESVYQFQRLCEEAQIKYEIHRDNSIAVEELQYESMFADLIIVNKHEKFTRIDEKNPSGFIKEILADVQCPVVVVPDHFKIPEKIVLLYDGSPSSIFAIKMFSYLFKDWGDLPVDLVSVNEGDIEEGQLPGNILMVDFMNRCFPNVNYSLLNGNVEENILAYLNDSGKNDLVVLGAYRRNKFSRWVKHSLADVLMNGLDKPLFIAHH